MINLTSLLLSVFLLPGLTGCGIFIPINQSESKLANLNLGDDRKTVLAMLGRPDVSRANVAGDSGKPTIIDEYHLYESGTAGRQLALFIPTFTYSLFAPVRDYSIYTLTYVNGKLTQWGRAGDWQK